MKETNRKKKGIKAYEILVTLDLEKYKATRRLIIPADIDFLTFHRLLISLFEWEDYHMAKFDLTSEEPEDLYWVEGEETILKMPDEFQPNAKLMNESKIDPLIESYPYIYWTYDYGDNWVHEIKLLEVYDDYKGEYPYLLEAEYSGPPEDVGGVSGFLEFIDVLNHPDSQEYLEYFDWNGGWTKNLTKKERTPHKLKLPKS